MEVKRESKPQPRALRCQPVSILVLMEVKRERRATGVQYTIGGVSILVLMEVKRECPHCSATRVGTWGFNPCFDGSEAREKFAFCPFQSGKVSILVLMEVKREFILIPFVCLSGGVSILVLMEVKREFTPIYEWVKQWPFQSLF